VARRGAAATVSVPLYMDIHIAAAVTAELRRRGVDVLTAQEDGRRTRADPVLLDRATQLGRAFVTHDSDFLAEGRRRQRAGVEFGGVLYSHELRITIGELIDSPHFVAEASDAGYMRNRVEWLPL
jgi:hypothetical protein